jgi:hypothetical protein
MSSSRVIERRATASKSDKSEPETPGTGFRQFSRPKGFARDGGGQVLVVCLGVDHRGKGSFAVAVFGEQLAKFGAGDRKQVAVSRPGGEDVFGVAQGVLGFALEGNCLR